RTGSRSSVGASTLTGARLALEDRPRPARELLVHANALTPPPVLHPGRICVCRAVGGAPAVRQPPQLVPIDRILSSQFTPICASIRPSTTRASRTSSAIARAARA